MVERLGQVKDLCSDEFIMQFFTHLDLNNSNVTDMDFALRKFDRLRSLNLSFNAISRIEGLPASLEELYLNGNVIDEVSIPVTKPVKALRHLGVSFNKIKQPALTHIVKVFPNLLSLDVSFNDLVDLETSLTWLAKLPLKMLSMEGNPLVL